jgi:hypothetical protein
MKKQQALASKDNFLNECQDLLPAALDGNSLLQSFLSASVRGEVNIMDLFPFLSRCRPGESIELALAPHTDLESALEGALTLLHAAIETNFVVRNKFISSAAYDVLVKVRQSNRACGSSPVSYSSLLFCSFLCIYRPHMDPPCILLFASDLFCLRCYGVPKSSSILF